MCCVVVNERSREAYAQVLVKIAARTTRPANGLVVVLVGADDTVIPFWGGWIPHTQGARGRDRMERMNVLLPPAAMGYQVKSEDTRLTRRERVRKREGLRRKGKRWGEGRGIRR